MKNSYCLQIDNDKRFYFFDQIFDAYIKLKEATSDAVIFDRSGLTLIQKCGTSISYVGN